MNPFFHTVKNLLVTRRERVDRENPNQTDMVGRRRYITIGSLEVYIRYIYTYLLSRSERPSRGNLFQLIKQLEQFLYPRNVYLYQSFQIDISI